MGRQDRGGSFGIPMAPYGGTLSLSLDAALIYGPSMDRCPSPATSSLPSALSRGDASGWSSHASSSRLTAAENPPGTVSGGTARAGAGREHAPQPPLWRRRRGLSPRPYRTMGAGAVRASGVGWQKSSQRVSGRIKVFENEEFHPTISERHLQSFTKPPVEGLPCPVRNLKRLHLFQRS